MAGTWASSTWASSSSRATAWVNMLLLRSEHCLARVSIRIISGPATAQPIRSPGAMLLDSVPRYTTGPS